MSVVPSTPHCEFRSARSRGLPAVNSIELLDDLIGEIDGVFIVDHNFNCLLAAPIDDQSKPGFLRYSFCG